MEPATENPVPKRIEKQEVKLPRSQEVRLLQREFAREFVAFHVRYEHAGAPRVNFGTHLLDAAPGVSERAIN